MASIVTKTIKGKEYLYLVDSVREKERVIQRTIKYVGKKRPINKHEFNSMLLSYKKEDWILNNFQDQLSYQEHHQMHQASEKYRKYLQSLDSTSQEKEKERFLSNFIANSNAIEGSTLTPEDTFNYLFNDLTPSGKSKKELFMASNLLKAWRYLENNVKMFPTQKHILEMHKLVNKEIESEQTLGKFKQVQNYIGEVYTTSYLFVEERIKELFLVLKKAYKNVDDFEVAFQSHAQFEIIHPFVDGNGRVGRLLLNWLLMHKKLMPLAISFKKRAEYITALNNARNGKMEAICQFCYTEYLVQYEFM